MTSCFCAACRHHATRSDVHAPVIVPCVGTLTKPFDADGRAERIPLCLSHADIARLPRLRLLRDDGAPTNPRHPVHHVHTLADLPPGRPSVSRLLFPDHGDTAHEPPAAAHVVGFDLEWRAQMGGRQADMFAARPGGGGGGNIVPVSVVQLSSCHATVVVNLLALGRSMLGAGTSAGPACREAVQVVAGVLADQVLLKVGLQTGAGDVKRLVALEPRLQLRNIVDCQVRPHGALLRSARSAAFLHGSQGFQIGLHALRVPRQLSATEQQAVTGALGCMQELAGKLGFRQLGMRSLLGAVLGLQLSKESQVSDWQQDRLSDECAPPYHLCPLLGAALRT